MELDFIIKDHILNTFKSLVKVEFLKLTKGKQTQNFVREKLHVKTIKLYM